MKGTAARKVWLPLLLAASWLGAALVVWSQLPLPGRLLFSSRHSTSPLGLDSQGNLVLKHSSPRKNSETILLTIHSPATGALQRSLLTSQDEVLSTRLADDLVIATNHWSTQLISTADGNILVKHPSSSRKAELSPSAKRFFVLDGQALTVYDTGRGEKIWSRESVRFAKFWGDHAILADVPLPEDPGNTRIAQLLRLDSGTGAALPDSDAPIAVGCTSDLTSPDGAYLLSLRDFRRGAITNSVYQYGSDQPLWTLKLWPDFQTTDLFGQSVLGPSLFSFSPDSKELQLKYESGQHRLGLARWRSEDGSVIAPLKPDSRPSDDYTGKVTADGKWAVREDFSEEVDSFRLLNFLGAKLPVWSTRWLSRPLTARMLVIDNEHDLIAGHFSLPPSPKLLTVDGGVLAVTDREVYRYELPPSPNYPWLLKWGILPAGVMGFGTSRLLTGGKAGANGRLN